MTTSAWSVEAHPGDPWLLLRSEGVPPIRVRLGRTDRGLVCIGLCLEAPRDQEITASVLRSVPLASVVRRMASLLGEDGSPLATVSGALILPEWQVPQHRGPRGYPPEHYVRVLKRWEAHEGRTSRVAAELHASPATVRRWLVRARQTLA